MDSGADGDCTPFRARGAGEHSVERDDDHARGPEGEGTREVNCVHAAQAVSTRERRSEARHRPVHDERRLLPRLVPRA